MHDFEHKENLESRLEKEIELSEAHALFINSLSIDAGDGGGGFVSEFIGREFIEIFDNQYNIKDDGKEMVCVFDDIHIFGEMLKRKAKEKLGEFWIDDNIEE